MAHPALLIHPGKVVLVGEHFDRFQPGCLRKTRVDQFVVGLGVASHQGHRLQIFLALIGIQIKPAVSGGEIVMLFGSFICQMRIKVPDLVSNPARAGMGQQADKFSAAVFVSPGDNIGKMVACPR